MTISNIRRTTSIPRVMRYLLHGHGSKESRAVAISLTSALRTDDPMKWAYHAQESAQQSLGQNVNTGLTLVHSFSLDEIDPKDPKQVAMAMQMVGEIIERHTGGVGPSAQVAHADGKAGLLHIHSIMANHNYSTNRPLEKSTGNYWKLRKITDEVIKEYGLTPLVQHEVSMSRTERLAQREGITWQAYDSDYQPTEVNAYTWRDHLRVRVENLMADPECVDLATMQEKAQEHGVSMWYYPAKSAAKKDAITWGLLDERTGETMYVPSAKKGRTKCACSGKSLGTDYMVDHAIEMAQKHAEAQRLGIEEQQRLSVARAQQMVLQEMENLDLIMKEQINGYEAPATSAGDTEESNSFDYSPTTIIEHEDDGYEASDCTTEGGGVTDDFTPGSSHSSEDSTSYSFGLDSGGDIEDWPGVRDDSSSQGNKGSDRAAERSESGEGQEAHQERNPAPVRAGMGADAYDHTAGRGGPEGEEESGAAQATGNSEGCEFSAAPGLDGSEHSGSVEDRSDPSSPSEELTTAERLEIEFAKHRAKLEAARTRREKADKQYW